MQAGKLDVTPDASSDESSSAGPSPLVPSPPSQRKVRRSASCVLAHADSDDEDSENLASRAQPLLAIPPLVLPPLGPRRAEFRKAIVYGNVEISADWLTRLANEDELWLCSDILSGYFKLVASLAPPGVSVFAASSEWYEKLAAPRTTTQEIIRWLPQLFSASRHPDLFIAPLHVDGGHWCCAFVCFADHLIEVYDSMGGHRDREAEKITKTLDTLLLARRPLSSLRPWKIKAVRTPEQGNGYDCGVLACMFAKARVFDLNLGALDLADKTSRQRRDRLLVTGKIHLPEVN